MAYELMKTDLKDSQFSLELHQSSKLLHCSPDLEADPKLTDMFINPVQYQNIRGYSTLTTISQQVTIGLIW